ncbi:hypothetical protein AAJV73_16275 [Cyanobium sp. BSA11S]|uniref:hypothetical protein n=1 Tax=Synechococcales TaxID=1890424 RepID=UPI00210363AC|nr:hypothetical protein [Synechococcus sp. BSF8S]
MPSRSDSVEDWPYLDQDVLVTACSPKACLMCQLHQGMIAPGEQLTRRCQGWTEDLARQLS